MKAAHDEVVLVVITFVKKHPFLIALLLLFIVWQLWNPVTDKFFGGRRRLQDAVEGEWVGQVDITRGYDPIVMGYTAGPHKVAAVYFKLELYDLFLKNYKGPGEFYIIGELKPRPITMEAFGVSDSGRVGGSMASNPDFAGRLNGSYSKSDPNRMTIATTGDLLFHGEMHKGTLDEYHTLVKKLQSSPVAN